MRRVALLVLLAAGCPGGDTPAVDATDAPIDGTPIDGDGDAMPRTCPASPPTPTQATTGGSVLGQWTLTWTCENGCIGNRPGLTYSREVEITAGAFHFTSATCAKCELTHAAAPSIAGCSDVEAGADWDVQCRFSYRLCERNGGVEAVVTWQEPGLSPQRWRLNGRRP